MDYCCAALDAGPDGRSRCRRRERLAQEHAPKSFEAMFQIRTKLVPAGENHADIVAQTLDSRKQRIDSGWRKNDVENERVDLGSVVVENPFGLGDASRGEDAVALLLEDTHQQPEQLRLVIDDEQGRGGLSGGGCHGVGA